jgi:uncharacterized protein YbjT (DUF2867 family)
MTSPILLTGGTGTLGQHVVPLLREAGHDLRVLSRQPHQPENGVEFVAGDLLEGEGIEAAVDGVATVVHLAGGPKGDDAATRNLARAASRARVQHMLYISVIGADRVPVRWLQSKLGAEKAVVGSGVPWTILRAAQFHDLALTVVQKMAKLPVVPVPGGLRFQPVDSREVAARLVELTLDRPAGRVADLAGPTVYAMGDLVRGYLQARGKHRLMMPVRLPGKAGRAYRAGDNLNLRAARGARTWEEFLAERVPSTTENPARDHAAASRSQPRPQEGPASG